MGHCELLKDDGNFGRTEEDDDDDQPCAAVRARQGRVTGVHALLNKDEFMSYLQRPSISQLNFSSLLLCQTGNVSQCLASCSSKTDERCPIAWCQRSTIRK
jgi:hypothetical protein